MKLKNFVIDIVIGGSILIGVVIGAVVGAILSQKSRWICFLRKIQFSFYLFQRQLLPIFHLNEIQINVFRHKVEWTLFSFSTVFMEYSSQNI